jgi:hypothetical protein
MKTGGESPLRCFIKTRNSPGTKFQDTKKKTKKIKKVTHKLATINLSEVGIFLVLVV